MNPTPEKRAITEMCEMERLKEVRAPVLARGSFCTDRCTCGTEKQQGSRSSKLSEKLGIAMEEYLPIFHSPIKHLTQQYYCDNHHISVCLVYNHIGKFMVERMVDMLEGGGRGYE